MTGKIVRYTIKGNQICVNPYCSERAKAFSRDSNSGFNMPIATFADISEGFRPAAFSPIASTTSIKTFIKNLATHGDRPGIQS